jgi:adenylate cyclase
MILTLRRKLLGLSAVIAVIPLLFAGQSLIRIARDEMKSAANDQLVTTVREVTGQIDDIYERAWLAPLLLIRNAVDGDEIGVPEKIAILTHGISQLPDIVALQISVEGSNLPLVVSQERFSAKLARAGLEPLSVLRVPPESVMAASGAIENANLASEPASDGEREARITAVSHEPKSDSWIATVTLPLNSKFGGSRAALSARIDLERIENFIMDQPFRQIGLITTVDRNGMKLFDPEVKDLTKREIVRKALDVTAGGGASVVSVESYSRPDGTAMLGAFAPVKSFGWVTMVEKKEADAYYAADVMMRSLAMWIAGGLLVAIIAAVAFAHGISRPILAIGDAANEVAKGNFAVRVNSVRSRDEIGELAARINNMIVQIAERFALAKFVSHGTIAAIQHSPAATVSLGGTRREVAVLFADIRGYTAFAESRDPETVVEVLNLYLRHQAEIVTSHNGDIDKFVGDQIMAVFQGPRMAADAVACAVAIQERMAELALANPDRDLSVGIGIDLGWVVMGAIGAQHRMDFTVLGDHVNLAARLCSAAKPRQTLASAAVVAMASAEKLDPAVITERLEPIAVKGKSAPIDIYEVRGTAAVSDEPLAATA